ncbi:MAG: sigma-70 family RNA polymerase sigma factor [Pseudomonadota bacterium]
MSESNDYSKIDADHELVVNAIKELPYRTRAYETLMRKYERLIFSVCLRMLNNQADAQDLSQDVMFKVFNTLVQFEGRSTFKTWLMRVTTNMCLTHISKNKRRGEIREQWSEDMAGDQVTHIKTAAFDVQSLLQDIKPAEREVLTLRYLADMSLQDIASACDISLSAAKMRLYRATEALNSKIAE